MAARQLEIDDYLAIPYVLSIESVPGPTGYRCQAGHPELPSCTVVGADLDEALDRLDIARARLIRERLGRGEPIPIPRPPLSDLLPRRSFSVIR